VNVGDVVTVRVTGQRARIVEERGSGYDAIEYLLDAMSDPMIGTRPGRRNRRGCTASGTWSSRPSSRPASATIC
jgi:hypothetical protein